MFAHANINNIYITLGYRYCTYRSGLKETIRDIGPGDAHIGGLPESATGSPHIVDYRIAFDPRSAVGSSAAEGPDIPPFHGFEDGVVVGGVFFGLGVCELKAKNEKEEWEEAHESNLTVI